MKLNKKEKRFLIILFAIVIILFTLETKYNPNGDNKEKIYCQASQRNIDACIEIYQPVCGWFNSEKIQCITYPCAQTFSNSCFACGNEDILYYTKGECPKSTS